MNLKRSLRNWCFSLAEFSSCCRHSHQTLVSPLLLRCSPSSSRDSAALSAASIAVLQSPFFRYPGVCTRSRTHQPRNSSALFITPSARHHRVSNIQLQCLDISPEIVSTSPLLQVYLWPSHIAAHICPVWYSVLHRLRVFTSTHRSFGRLFLFPPRSSARVRVGVDVPGFGCKGSGGFCVPRQRRSRDDECFRYVVGRLDQEQ